MPGGEKRGGEEDPRAAARRRVNEVVLLRPEVDEAMEEALGRAILPHGTFLGKSLLDRHCEVSVWLVCCAKCGKVFVPSERVFKNTLGNSPYGVPTHTAPMFG